MNAATGQAEVHRGRFVVCSNKKIYGAHHLMLESGRWWMESKLRIDYAKIQFRKSGR